jgi:DNA-binding transcriptional MerR regulator
VITVGQAAGMFGLSRTALLYYESIGLLAAKRADNGYRMYDEEDIERLRQIVTLRNAGVPLSEIPGCIASPDSGVYSILIKSLGEINDRIENSRKQQAVIIKLLKDSNLRQKRELNAQEWMEILRRAGIEEHTALEWHIRFESQSPEQHQNLLRALGFSREERELFRSVYESLRGESSAGQNETI